MVTLSLFYRRAVDAIALAGQDGLPVGDAAAAAAAPSTPRPALVKWLLSALIRHGAVLTVEQVDDVNGGFRVAASLRCRLRALGHSSLEHPTLTGGGARALAILGAAGAKGGLQSNLSALMGTTFSTAHHYLLGLLAHDLLVRRRVPYKWGPDHVTVPDVEGVKPGGCTSRIVIARHAASLAAESDAEERAEERAGEVTGAVTSAGPEADAKQRPKRPRKMEAETVFDLACQIVDILRERPNAVAAQYELKERLLPVSHDARHRSWAAARDKLLRCGIISLEAALCIDDLGRPQGEQTCLRLRSAHIEKLQGASGRRGVKAELCQDSGEGGPVVGVDKHLDDGECGRVDMDVDSDGDAGLDDDADGTYPGLSGDGKKGGSSEAALAVDSNLTQQAYLLLKQRGAEGMSAVDLATEFSPFIDIRQARMAFRILKNTVDGAVQQIKYHGRTKRLTLVLAPAGSPGRTERDATAAPQRPSHNPLWTPTAAARKPEGTCAGEPTALDRSQQTPGASPTAPRAAVSSDGAGPPPFDPDTCTYVPTRMAGISILGHRRVQLVEHIVRHYRVLRVDKIGRLVGFLEGKDSFQVDRRVVGRLVDCVVRDGRAKVFLFSVCNQPTGKPAPDASGDEAVDPDGSAVSFVAVPDFDDEASDVLQHVTQAQQRLHREARRRQVPKVTGGDPRVGGLTSAPPQPVAAFVTVASRSSAKKERRRACATLTEKSGPSTVLEQRLARVNAISLGWSKGFMLRAHAFHKAFYEYASDRLTLAATAGGFSTLRNLGVVREVDVVNFMTLRSFSSVVGLFGTFENIHPAMWNERVGNLPSAMRTVLLASSQGLHQRSIMLAFLLRMGLITSSPGDHWVISKTALLRDYGKGVPAGLEQRPVPLRSAAALDAFWNSLESFKDVPQNERAHTPVASPSTFRGTKGTLAAKAAAESGDAVLHVVGEVYDKHRWEPNEDLVLPLPAQMEVEKCLQHQLRLLRAAGSGAPGGSGHLPVKGRSFQFGPIPLQYMPALYSRVNSKFRVGLPFDRIVRYLQGRATGEVAGNVKARLQQDAAAPTPPARRRGRVANASTTGAGAVLGGKRARAPLKWVARDVELLVFASRLRAVVEAQQTLLVRSDRKEDDWHVRGMMDGAADEEMHQLWKDVADTTSMSVLECKDLFVRLCEEPAIRSQFQRAVLHLRSSALYRTETDVAHDGESCRDDEMRDDRKGDSRDPAAEFRAAIEKASSAKQRREKRRRRHVPGKRQPKRQRSVQAARTHNAAPLPPQPPRLSTGVTDTTARVTRGREGDGERAAAQRFEHMCALGVLAKPAVAADERAGSGRLQAVAQDTGSLPPVNPACQHRPALIGQVLLIVLREPLASFRVDNAVSMLRRFAAVDLVRARDVLLARRLICPVASSAAPDPSGRLFKLSFPACLAGAAAHKTAEAIHTAVAAFENRITAPLSSVNPCVNVVTSSVSRSELVATLQVTFFPRDAVCASLQVRAKPSPPDAGPVVAQVLEDEVEGRVFLQCTLQAVNDGGDIDGSDPGARSDSPLTHGGDRTPESMEGVLRQANNHRSFDDRAQSAATSVLKAVDEEGWDGVRSCDILSHPQCVGLPLVSVVRALARLVRARVVARLGVACDERRGSIVYMRYERACSLYGIVAPSMAPCEAGRDETLSVPMTHWSRLDGQLDDDLCKRAQTRILSHLTVLPGADEDSLLRLVEPLTLPGQASADVLWALVCRGIIRRKFVRKRRLPCTLFSAPPRFASEPELNPAVLHFVDGMQVSRLDEDYAVHYCVRGRASGTLLSARDVVLACEESPML